MRYGLCPEGVSLQRALLGGLHVYLLSCSPNFLLDIAARIILSSKADYHSNLHKASITGS